jgi:aspartyl-tRNA(Asn)/glutamyl-tRNA(Gln) amidotransferase subunit B
VDRGVLTGNGAKQVLEAAFRTGTSPARLVDELGLAQVSDSSALESAVDAALAANPAAVADYHAGKASAINFLKGQVMKATRGKANPGVVDEMLRTKLQ